MNSKMATPGKRNVTLERAIRENHRRRELEKFLSSISGRSSLTWFDSDRLVDLDASAALDKRLRERFCVMRSAGLLTVQERLNREDLALCVKEILSTRSGDSLLLFLCNWTALGAIKADGWLLSQSILDLIDVDGDSVYGSTVGEEFVFVVDYDASRGPIGYEVAFGDVRLPR